MGYVARAEGENKLMKEKYNMTGNDVSDLLFSSNIKNQKKALNYIEKLISELDKNKLPLKKTVIKKIAEDVNLPALLVFALAKPFLEYTEEVYTRMRDMIHDGVYIEDRYENDDYLYRLSDICESARSLIEKVPGLPKKLDYRLNQEYIRYVCECGQERVVEKLIELTQSTDGVSLYWKGTRLRKLPEELLKFSNIKSMEFHTVFLKEFPSVLLKSDQLEELTIHSSKISSIPEGIKVLKRLKKLAITRNVIESLPDEIGELSSLEELDLSKNKLTELPAGMARLDRLKIIHLGSNPMTSTLQVRKLFQLFVEQSIEYKYRLVYLHLIFARIEEVLDLNDLQAVVMALNMPLSIVQDNAMLALERMCQADFKKHPPGKGSLIRVCGKVNDIDVSGDELQALGIGVTDDVNALCSHILIGVSPGDNIDLSMPVLTSRMISQLLEGDEQAFFLDETQDSGDTEESLIDLLLSNDTASQLLAFEMIKSLGMSRNIILNVYFVYRITSDKAIRSAAKQLLLKDASKAFLQIVNKSQSFNNASEPGFSRYLKELVDIADIDVLDFARLVFDKTGFGVNFLFDNGSSKDISGVIRKTISTHGYLNLRYSHIKRLPDEVGNFSELTRIDLSGNLLRCLPESIGKLKNLDCLIIYENKISVLPESFSKLTSLRHVDIRFNNLKKFPEQITELSKLEILHIENNSIKAVPEGVSKLKVLNELGFGGGSLGVLPEALMSLESLNKLNVESSALTRVPESIKRLKNLKILDLSSCYMTDFPVSVCGMNKLESLYLSNNRIKYVPVEIELMLGLKTLNLNSNGLTEFPMNIFRLTSLEALEITYNKITVFPEMLSEMVSLKRICVGDYGFNDKVISQVKALVHEGCVVE